MSEIHILKVKPGHVEASGASLKITTVLIHPSSFFIGHCIRLTKPALPVPNQIISTKQMVAN